MMWLEIVKIHELLLYVLAACYIGIETQKRDRNKDCEFTAVALMRQLTNKLGKVSFAEGSERVYWAVKTAAVDADVEL